jgi:prevent-host-death family protein
MGEEPPMTRLSASKARDEFSDALNRVAYKGERIVLRRRGKDIAVLVPLDDLKLLEEIEDRIDAEEAKKTLREKGGIEWKKLKKELGL